MNVYFSPAYAGSGYAFETTRKSQWVAQSMDSDPIAGISLRLPQPLSLEQVNGVHDAAYVRAVQTGVPLELAQSQGLTWDAGLWPMVLASNGGVVAASLDALQSGLSGTLSSGLHHAGRGKGYGYCTFNGLVLAARAALDAGARSVLILDLDAHCGGGTASLIAGDERIWQLDVSVDDYDHYESSDRVRLSMVQRSEDYLAAIDTALQDLAARGPRFDLCLYNAGMDPFEGCPDGGLPGISIEMLTAREHLVFEWCRSQRLPVAFTLAGGYVGEGLDKPGLVGLHRLTLSAAALGGPIHCGT